jgi:hypothetical protein
MSVGTDLAVASVVTNLITILERYLAWLSMPEQ